MIFDAGFNNNAEEPEENAKSLSDRCLRELMGKVCKTIFVKFAHIFLVYFLVKNISPEDTDDQLEGGTEMRILQFQGIVCFASPRHRASSDSHGPAHQMESPAQFCSPRLQSHHLLYPESEQLFRDTGRFS